MSLTIKELIDLKDILSTDSISTTRLTINDDFHKLRKGIIAIIDSLGIDAGPNVIVNSVQADDIVANSFATPLPRGGVYNFRVNSNGEITAKSIITKVVVETPRIRLDPDPTTAAFQAGEIRWSGSDFVGYNGTAWISLTAGATGGEANTASNVGTGTGVFNAKLGVDLQFKKLQAGTGITLDNISDPLSIKINSTSASGFSGYSGSSGATGTSTSGFSGKSGISGYSGISGTSGTSGRGTSGFSGVSGTSGTSGTSGNSTSGYSGLSGYSGVGTSGFSGAIGGIGVSGYSGASGISGLSGAGQSGQSGFSGEGSSVIGPAEDGSYLDGLFTDFNPLTPIGTAVDRFNEVLLALAPGPAPILTDWNQTTLSLSVPGKLSFDSTFSIIGYIPADTAIPPVSVDQLFADSGKRLGISQAIGGGDLSGVLNYQVTVGPGTPDASYPAQSFGDADQGTLILYVNGVEIAGSPSISFIDLTSTTAAIDTTSGGTTSGLSVSAQAPALFPNGAPLAGFQHRTGTWIVKKSDLSLGYNYIQVVHQSVTPTFFTRSLAVFEVVLDGSIIGTTYTTEVLYNPNFSGTKKISGIDYKTSGSILYDIQIHNAYHNTYNPSASAISFTGNSNSYGVVLTAPAQALGICGGNPNAVQNIIAKVATVSAGMRLINESLTLSTTTLRTVQPTTTSLGNTMLGFLLDNIAASSTNTIENFDDENYRVNTNSNYDLITDVTSPGNIWDGIQSLIDGSAGHTTGLQVIDGRLIYPGQNVSYPLDFRTTNIIHGSVFNNGGVGGTGRNYTTAVGNRTYIRKFLQVSPTTANFVMTINGIGGTFVSLGTALTGNNIHVEIKGPTETGWMDAYNDFSTGNFGDGDGARNASGGVGRAFGTAWGLTIGTKSTANTGGYMMVRITTGPTFSGSFISINWTFA